MQAQKQGSRKQIPQVSGPTASSQKLQDHTITP